MSGAGSPVVIHLITRLELGGAQETTLATVKGLDKARWDVVLGFGPGGILDAEAEGIAGVTVVKVRHLVREISPFRDLAALVGLRGIIRRYVTSGRPVIVHTHSSKAGILGRWAARLAGATATVHTIHGFGFTTGQGTLVRGLLRLAERRTAPITDRLIFVSSANMAVAASLGFPLGGRGVLIRSAMPVDRFFPDRARGGAWRTQEGIAPDVPLIGQVSCLKEQKAPLDYVAACSRVAAEVPGAVFVLAGDGELRVPVEAAAAVAAGLAGRFRVLGWRRDVPDLLRALDCLVLSSRWEGLPKTVVEGMLTGVPVVACAVDGVTDVLHDGVGGYTVPAGDVAALAERIGGIITGRLAPRPADRKALAREFDEGVMVAAHEQLYSELLG